MTCNLEKYLAEKELECRRIARSCNEGTVLFAEWIQIAEILLEKRREHTDRCLKCSKES